MPARAIVPGEAFPCIDRFRGHGPLLQGHGPLLQRPRYSASIRSHNARIMSFIISASCQRSDSS